MNLYHTSQLIIDNRQTTTQGYGMHMWPILNHEKSFGIVLLVVPWTPLVKYGTYLNSTTDVIIIKIHNSMCGIFGAYQHMHYACSATQKYFTGAQYQVK